MKKIQRLIRKLCATKNRHLVPIHSMKIRWNTTHAEIMQGLDLKPALNQWVDLMDQGISGKAKTAAKRHQKKWRLSPDEWDSRGWRFLEIPGCHFRILAIEGSHYQQSPPSFQDDSATFGRRAQGS
ncbi:hypothetical protein PILCRDRAFT_609148 [Piloderma croceum F 1598]|uniref:Uncharacterized protein n=1 Tax=Piloderma croceum (strain F 1598) TaxID=765440 RepID=A0A0C3AV08_PILCF|nr:hypothetical protein PILCRDRAFT_609148 [Piloderma croceum F 1598]